MGSKKNEKKFLYGILMITLGVLLFIMKRQPRKDWFFAYGFNAITNIAIDKWVTGKYISYPTRLFSKIFKIHVLYDTVLYPTATVIYNQMTSKDRLPAIVYKVFLFTVPLTLFEFWAERKTGLIKWLNGWTWYHTFLSVSLKSLITRGSVTIYRKII
ncbi:CBO0543 family protein [Cohnella sp. JJ-181]|uniref:CBO0543 family protein n=1 Tax=Cohnella rhizoplanae TaxID=2974897 RepID=UPI00232E10A3|nr:CBO0543 family protein [Cohnella sp. JJ-181]